ncbi:MAG TPA: hypothetical protein VHY22_03870 [Chthoniobacteraceae bacterium]|jgi:hypothetical protein|nr:hypothetical protein [Chthoniobacteraceae bacterium]
MWKTPALRRKKPQPDEEKSSGFEKVENAQFLYRYIPNGKYYAVVKFGGKKKRHSLEVRDEAAARRAVGDCIRDLEKLDAFWSILTLAYTSR